MARVQLALNGSDLEAAIDFYTRLFDSCAAGAEPAAIGAASGASPSSCS